MPFRTSALCRAWALWLQALAGFAQEGGDAAAGGLGQEIGEVLVEPADGFDVVGPRRGALLDQADPPLLEQRRSRRGAGSNRQRRGVQQAKRQADRLAQVLGGGRQDESVERRIELDGHRVGPDAAALEQVDPAALVKAPARVAKDETLVRLRQDLDGGAQVVARAGAGRDQGAGAPGARHPAHAAELGGGDARVGQRRARRSRPRILKARTTSAPSS